MSEVLLRVSDIVKTFSSGEETLRILKGLSFTIERGSAVSITGQSGSGKSTLLNIIGGLDRADSGLVEVSGIRITDLPETELTSYRRDKVGFIFQFHYLLKDFTALENVMLPAYMAGMGKQEALDRARMLLGDLKLEERVNHYPSQLSGGERQRVAVARSMVNNPDLILADEPTGNLDPSNSMAVADLLYAEAEKQGKTLIVVTHDEEVARKARINFSLRQGELIP